jgi:serine/threonine protein kinase/Tol biopolymer transport system component
MNLEPGTAIGPYKIVARLGAGGMGEVWKAHDTRLNRDVAIKTSQEQFNARFQQEARAVAALNHPNICHLYDVGPDYIVMELVEGHNLRGPLPSNEALKVADQIASALEAAHEKGIVHRDLKPGNIRVTPEGVVKVLDFGLALMPTEEPDEDPENAPTRVITPHTEAGMAIGTPAYMSPEQARGKVVDKRSDIWAFGIILYILFTGRGPFESETRSDTIAGVLTKDPDLSQAPPTVRRLLRSCLEKDPRQRLRDIGDWRKLLDEPAAAPAPPPVTPRRREAVAAAILAAGFAGALLAFAVFNATRATPPSSEPLYRRLTNDNGLNDFPALSRDGKLVAYASDRAGGGNLDIWLQQIGGREAIQLSHDPDDETDPSFSPDGTRIAFRSDRSGGAIYSVQTLGGDPVLLVAGGRNPRYSPDGKWIVYWTGRGEGSFVPGSSHVFVVDANGGQPRAIHPEMAVAEFPVWSPRGDAVIVQGRKDTQDSEDFWVLPIDAGEPFRTGAVPLFKSNGWRALQIGLRVEPAVLDWVDAGEDRLLSATIFGDSANLWETRLDRKGKVKGLPRRLTRGPGRQAHASWAITDSSEMLAFADESVNYDIWTAPVDARGAAHAENATRLTDSLATEWAPSLSADGEQMLFIGRRSGYWAVLLRNVEAGRDRELTSSSTLLVNAVISGDGSHAVWTTSGLSMYAMPLAGSQSGGPAVKLCEHCGTVLSTSYDGRYVAYEPVANEDLMAIDAVEHKPIELAPRPNPNIILSGTEISPDGKWVAFHAIDHETRTTQIWIARVDFKQPASGQSWVAVTDGKTFAQDPSWSPDGNTLYFKSERDGFRCYWGQHLDAATKKPASDPFPVRHFHSARQTLRGSSSSGYLTRISAGRGRVVFAMAEVRGSIWLAENARAR